MDETGKQPSDTKITVIKTSAEILSEPGGKDGGEATVDSRVQEGSQGRGTFTATSQQLSGEHKRLDSSY
jgi:hypothetical protein